MSIFLQLNMHLDTYKQLFNMLNIRIIPRFFHSSPCWLDGNKLLLSELRKKTGYTFMNCKKALEVNNNDVAQAEKWLREQALIMGWEKALKLAGRNALQGLIAVASDDKSAAMVEVNCETDFVAKNNLFQHLVMNVARTCFAVAKEQTRFEYSISKLYLDASQLLDLQGAEGKKLADETALLVSQVGEKVSLRRALCINVTDEFYLTGCTHPTVHGVENANNVNIGRYGAILLYKMANPSPEISTIAKQMCQHVIGMKPEKIGTPENDEPKENKENETCMINQEFIMDPEVTVLQILLENGLSLGEFTRFECGEELRENSENSENLEVARAAEK